MDQTGAKLLGIRETTYQVHLQGEAEPRTYVMRNPRAGDLIRARKKLKVPILETSQDPNTDNFENQLALLWTMSVENPGWEETFPTHLDLANCFRIGPQIQEVLERIIDVLGGDEEESFRPQGDGIDEEVRVRAGAALQRAELHAGPSDDAEAGPD